MHTLAAKSSYLNHNAFSFAKNSALNKPAKLSFNASKPQNTNPKTEKKKYKNPIKAGFEYFDATTATLGAAAYAVLEAFAWIDDPDIFFPKKPPKMSFREVKGPSGKILIPSLEKAGSKLASLKGPLKRMGVVSLAIGGLYFITHLPKNLYKKKKEIFVKKKEMDVYSRNNEAEKTLYERLDTEAKTAGFERKKELAENFMKMRMAKQSGASSPPSFVNVNTPPTNY